jgi:hypothetical protein
MKTQKGYLYVARCRKYTNKSQKLEVIPYQDKKAITFPIHRMLSMH